MKTLQLLLLACGLLLWTEAATAQTVRAQLIHASADPAVDTVDVYIDSALLIDDFAFLSATPFMDVEAGNHEIVLTSQDGTDSLGSFDIELETDSAYHLIVAGVLDPEEFNPNPDGRGISLNLFVGSGALEQSPDNRFWGRQFYAGTDLPKLRFLFGPDNHPPFADASYGDFTIYGGDVGQVASTKLSAAGVNGSPLWQTTTDSRSWGGKAFVSVTYGFFRDDDGMGFGEMIVFADGTVEMQEDEVPTYRAQFVQNTPDPSLDKFDLYMDGGLVVNDFEFQTATKFIELPSGLHTFDIAPSESANRSDGVMRKRVGMTEDATYHVVAAGVAEPGDWPANPDGLDTSLDLFMDKDAYESWPNHAEFGVRQFYGITDLPATNFLEASNFLFENKKFGEYTDYVNGEPGVYHGSLRAAGAGTSALVALLGDFSNVAGEAILETPSGFFRGPNGLGIDWIQVHADGTVTKPAQETHTYEAQIVHASPDPAVETVDVYLDGGLLIDDLRYKTAQPFLTLPYGIHELAITEASSIGKDDAVATFRENHRSDRNYSLVLAGVVDPELWPANPDDRDISLSLFSTDDALKTSPDMNEWAIRQFYGVLDLEAVDFWIEEIDHLAYEDAGFGEFTDIAQDDHRGIYTGRMIPAGSPQSDPDICTSRKDWGPYAGRAILSVWAGTRGDTDWFYVTPDGEAVVGEVECSAIPSTASEDETEIPSSFAIRGNYPNPFNPSTSIVFDLPESASVSVEIFDATGRMVAKTREAPFQVGAGHAVHVDATAWSSGLYLYKVIARGRTSSWIGSGQMLLVK